MQDIIDDNGLGLGYLYYLATAFVYIGISSAMVVWIEPAAGGSGIPEIKCILNGVNVRAVLGMKALIVKMVGIGFSYSGGLIIGNEGPLV
jgi:H+/Cl- antiporter ClcA